MEDDEIKSIIIEGYRNILRREPDPEGLANYINEIKKGLSTNRFHEVLRTSDEYKRQSEQSNKRCIIGTFGDGISWEEHITELPLNDRDKLFYKFDKNNDTILHTRKYIQKGKLIDCGCHIGRWIEFFENAGFDYTGIEQSSDVIKIALKYHPKTKFVNKFLWDIDFNEEFDIAMSIAVLQHNTLDEKKRILPKIYKALKKDAIFFMTESTVLEETKTQLTYNGWISLVEQNGFKFLESWHINELHVNDHYLFKRL